MAVRPRPALLLLTVGLIVLMGSWPVQAQTRSVRADLGWQTTSFAVAAGDRVR